MDSAGIVLAFSTMNAHDRRRIAAMAEVDDRSIRKAYKGGEVMRPATWGRIAKAARKLNLPAPEKLVTGEK